MKRAMMMGRQARRYLERAGKYHGYMLSEISCGSLDRAKRFKLHAQRCQETGFRWMEKARA